MGKITMGKTSKEFWKGKKVLVTGHTGFKGSWLCIWLHKLGAEVVGFSLEEWENEDLFTMSKLSSKITDVRGDVRDFETLKKVFDTHQPEIVLHLAAQPLVSVSYDDPLQTIQTNALGTANMLECIRQSKNIKSVVMITSDKCYENIEQVWGYRENDRLGGKDPYSCSKGCAELIIHSYRHSYFEKTKQVVASARAGNVMGGGDYSKDRIVPDCIKAILDGKTIDIRSPHATRPWQHVLEPLSGYLLLAQKVYEEQKYGEAWNFGPSMSSIKTVSQLTDTLIKKWGGGEWKDVSNPNQMHEARLLSLDISKAKIYLDWQPRLNFEETVQFIVDWYKNATEDNAYDLCIKQIEEYEQK